MIRALLLVGLLVLTLTACGPDTPTWVEWQLVDRQWTPFAGHTSLRACETSIGHGSAHPGYRCLPVSVTPMPTPPPYVLYLLWPPLAADGQPMLTAPLRTWQSDGGWSPWATIAECKEGRKLFEEYARGIMTNGTSAEDRLQGRGWWLQVRESLCIASNDPRLGGRP